MADQEQDEQPIPQGEGAQVRGPQERSGKDHLLNRSDGMDFEYVRCTESNQTIPSINGKGRVRLKVFRAGSSRVMISPSVDKQQGETHQKPSQSLPKHVSP